MVSGSELGPQARDKRRYVEFCLNLSYLGWHVKVLRKQLCL